LHCARRGLRHRESEVTGRCRRYQIESDAPPKDATFPAKFAVTGTILRGDGQPAAKIDVSLGDIKATTDDRGRFRFERLTGNLVDMPLSIAPLPR
jgi:hypothetical protein